MPNVNQTVLVGHLTRDAEMRYVGANNTALCTFGIAVTKKRGEKEFTAFLDCKCWGGTAEACAVLKKGEAAIVVGELTVESWDDKTTGAKRSKVVVQGDVVGRALYMKKDAGAKTAKAPEKPAVDATADDDVPF